MKSAIQILLIIMLGMAVVIGVITGIDYINIKTPTFCTMTQLQRLEVCPILIMPDPNVKVYTCSLIKGQEYGYIEVPNDEKLTILKHIYDEKISLHLICEHKGRFVYVYSRGVLKDA